MKWRVAQPAFVSVTQFHNILLERGLRPVINRRKILPIFLCLLLVVVTALVVAYIQSGREHVRGAWMTGYGTGYPTPDEIDRTITAAKAAKLNLIIVEVRRSADAYYRSDIEPLASGIPPNFDPLAYLLKIAHAEGINVHAWVSVYRIWRGDSTPSDPEHLANKHPDWIARSYGGDINAPAGIFVDPGVPNARDYITRVVTDIVRRYDIDGLHLDFIRYPDAQWGYSKISLDRYFAETGAQAKPKPNDLRWQEWKRDQVTDAVRAIRREVRRLKPELLTSAATIAYGSCPARFSDTYAYKHLGQDWRRWLSEDLIDANMPMNYRDTRRPEKLDEFREWLAPLSKWSCEKPVFVGLASYMSDAQAVEAQVDEVRRAGLDGFVVFCFNASGIRVMESRDKLAFSLAKTDSCWKKWKGNCGRFLDD